MLINELVLLSIPPAPLTHRIFQGIPKIFFPFFDLILLDFYLAYFIHNNIKKFL